MREREQRMPHVHKARTPNHEARLPPPSAPRAAAALTVAFTYLSSSLRYCTVGSLDTSLLLVQKSLVLACTDATTGARLFLPTPTVLGVAAGATLTIVNAAPASDVAQVLLKLETWLDANGPAMIEATMRPGSSLTLVAVPYLTSASRWAITASSPTVTTGSQSPIVATGGAALISMAYFAKPGLTYASCFDASACP